VIIMKTWKKIALTTGLAGLITASAFGAPKTTLSQSAVVQEQEPIHRFELLSRDLPMNSDVYGTWETQGDKELHKLRAETLPISYKGLSLGAVGQHVEEAPLENELGIIGRVAGKINDDTFGKFDVRYFPQSDNVDSYALIKNGKFFADEFSMYNLNTNKGFIRVGADYKIAENFAAGAEFKYLTFFR